MKSLSGDERALLRRTQLAVVFQDLRLFAQLSAEENIMLKASLTGFPETEALAMADVLGISSLLQKPCGILSMGQQQRVAIVRALCQPFDMLLLDEPFSHLDRENAGKVMTLALDKAKKNGAGIVVSSLNPEDVPSGFNRILI
jgi:ABC-type lipoprotein export system ATPase subunit